jgi:hypothetical protein
MCEELDFVSIVDPSNNVALPVTVALSSRKAPFATTVPMTGTAPARVMTTDISAATTDSTVSNFINYSSFSFPKSLVGAIVHFSQIVCGQESKKNEHPGCNADPRKRIIHQ